VGSHEHNLLPFGTPQSYPLLSAQSKAVSAANNKEMLAECHDIMFCRTILSVETSFFFDLVNDFARALIRKIT